MTNEFSLSGYQLPSQQGWNSSASERATCSTFLWLLSSVNPLMRKVRCTLHILSFTHITLVISLTACNPIVDTPDAATLGRLPSRIAPLFTSTKTVCFGLFVIDVPATATVVYGPAWIDSGIEFYPGDAHKIAQYITEQLAEVEEHRAFMSEGTGLLAEGSMFGKVVDGVVSGQKLVVGSLDHATYSVYSYIPVQNDLFVQHSDGNIRLSEGIANLNDIASKLRLRADDDIPSERGSCIEGGFVASSPVFEKVTVGIRLKEFTDVHLSIEVLRNQAYIAERSDLETRLKDAEQEGGHWHSRIKYLQRGARTLGNWKGTEVLALLPAQDVAGASHEFHFLSLGKPNSSLQPRLDIQLYTGASERKQGMVPPSLSDEEVLALWNKLIGSIRERPTMSIEAGT